MQHSRYLEVTVRGVTCALDQALYLPDMAEASIGLDVRETVEHTQPVHLFTGKQITHRFCDQLVNGLKPLSEERNIPNNTPCLAFDGDHVNGIIWYGTTVGFVIKTVPEDCLTIDPTQFQVAYS